MGLAFSKSRTGTRRLGKATFIDRIYREVFIYPSGALARGSKTLRILFKFGQRHHTFCGGERHMGVCKNRCRTLWHLLAEAVAVLGPFPILRAFKRRHPCAACQKWLCGSGCLDLDGRSERSGLHGRLRSLADRPPVGPTSF